MPDDQPIPAESIAAPEAAQAAPSAEPSETLPREEPMSWSFSNFSRVDPTHPGRYISTDPANLMGAPQDSSH